MASHDAPEPEPTEGSSPWAAAAQRLRQTHTTDAGTTVVSPSVAAQTGIQTPQIGVPAVLDQDAGLAVEHVDLTPSLWLVGAHGGAGESTLALLDDGWAASGHTWPVPAREDEHSVCVLLARTHAAGLAAAQQALTQWGAGDVDPRVELLGLILVADAPGRLPRPLRDLATHVAGGAPRTWRLGWIEDWRQGEPIDPSTLSKHDQALVEELLALSEPRRTSDTEMEED